MDEICKRCDNYIKITFLGRTVECCGGNVANPKRCSLRQDIYEKHSYLLTKEEFCKAVDMKPEKLLRILCRAEFSHIRKFVKDKKAYFSVTLKDVDELKKFK